MNNEELKKILENWIRNIDTIELNEGSDLVEKWAREFMTWGEVFKYINEEIKYMFKTPTTN